jgi:probable O-glycosylation ligase (exosortase A-associated)
VVAVITITLILVIMPGEWFERMRTIQTYEQDVSAMGRINAWTMAFNLALDRFFGSSFENVKFEYFLQYGLSTETALMQGPHSIYFQVLGQHGFVGLFLFLGMGISVWCCAGRVIRASDASAGEGTRDVMLGQMTKASILAFAVGGAFLGLAYFDMPYYLMLAISRLDQLTSKKEQAMPSREGVTA